MPPDLLQELPLPLHAGIYPEAHADRWLDRTLDALPLLDQAITTLEWQTA